MNFKLSDRKVKDLLNGEDVVVISDKLFYNCIVKWELADFDDTRPPFVEVCFNERCEEDTIYFTDNLEQDVYELDGVFIVKEDIVVSK